MRPLIVVLLLTAPLFAAKNPSSSDPWAALSKDKNQIALKKNQENISGLQAAGDALKKNPTQEAKDNYNAQVVETKSFADETAKQNPDDPALQAVTSVVAAQLGDSKTALKRSERAVSLAETQKAPPEELVEILKIRAVAYAESGDNVKANADAKRILKLFPDDETARKVELLTRGKPMAKAPAVAAGQPPPEDVQVLIDAVRPRPSPVNRPEGFGASVGHIKEAETDLKLGDYQRMYDEASSAVARLPDNPKGYMQRAFAALMLKNYEQVISDADAGLKLKPGSGSLLGLRAAAYNETGHPQKALEDAARAIDDNPKDPFAWLQKGLAREKLKEENDEYLDDIKNAGDLNPEFEHYYQEAMLRREGGGAPSAGARSEPAPPGKSKAWFLAAVALLGVIGAVFVIIVRRKAAAEAPTAAEGLLGGQFRVVRELGRGGMGVVYEAWDAKLERSVALKKIAEGLKDVPGESERLLREAKTVAGLKHPNVVIVHNAFEEGGDVYCVFELVRGQTLAEILEERGRVAPEDCLKLLAPVCDALDYAHKLKIVHRDLKPGNIMLEDGKIKVMDFGIARAIRGGKGSTMTESFIGTPAFMAPELWAGEVSPESDLYALAVTAYQLLTGRLPFEGAGMQADKMEARFAPASAYVKGKPGLDAFFAKALAADRTKRLRGAADFHSALKQALA